MPYSHFHDRFPDLAERETRVVTVPKGSNIGLPPGEYAFTEMFCDDENCDCRRVFWMVVSEQPSRGILAVIAYGWENRSFYVKWLGMDERKMIAEMQGPVLNVGSPQSKCAGKLLEIARDALIPDAAYMERVKRHYRMFRESVDGESKPRIVKLPRVARKRWRR